MAPGPASFFTAACLASLGGLGWWRAAVDQTAPPGEATAFYFSQAATASLQQATETAATVAGEPGGAAEVAAQLAGAPKQCLGISSSMTTSDDNDPRQESYHTKSTSKLRSISKVFLVVLLLAVEAGFLYLACQSLQLRRRSGVRSELLKKDASAARTADLSKQAQAKAQAWAFIIDDEKAEVLGTELGVLQPTWQPHVEDSDDSLPRFCDAEDTNDGEVVTSLSQWTCGSIPDEVEETAVLEAKSEGEVVTSESQWTCGSIPDEGDESDAAVLEDKNGAEVVTSQSQWTCGSIPDEIDETEAVVLEAASPLRQHKRASA